MLRKADEAIARMMMECRFLPAPRSSLPERMELKSFEVRKCIARLCKLCDSPSIWTEVLSDAPSEPMLGTRSPLEERVIPRRNRTRVKARVLACIRAERFQEEVAVCEDLSKAASRFAAGTNIPKVRVSKWRCRIRRERAPSSCRTHCISQHIPSAGLYRTAPHICARQINLREPVYRRFFRK